MTLDVIFLAWNRLEFTRFAWEKLVENTDWSLVRAIHVYDDGSTDGTYGFLGSQVVLDSPVPVVLHSPNPPRSGPVVIMHRYLRFDSDGADAFAKIDNDIAVSPGWLNIAVDVMERNPDLSLLGIEGGTMPLPGSDFDGVYGVEPSTHVGGVGVFRTEPFQGKRRRLRPDGRNGFTEWQHTHTEVGRGWLDPGVPFCCLDRVPIEPWRSLSIEYVERGWQRPWTPYDPRFPYWWEWFTPEEERVA